MSSIDWNQSAVIITLRTSLKGLLGERVDPGATDSVASLYKADRDAVRAKKYPISQTARSVKRVRATAQNLRNVVYYYAPPFMGGRILALNVKERFEKEFNSRLAEHKDAVENYLIDYPSLKANAMMELGDLFDSSIYPSQDRLRQMFQADLVYSPIPSSGHFLSSIGDDAKAKFDADMEDMICGACNHLVERVEQGLREYVARVGKYSGKKGDGVITPALIDNLKSTAQLINDLNFSGSEKLTKLSRDLEAIADYAGHHALQQNSIVREAAAQKGQALLDKIDQYRSSSLAIDNLAERYKMLRV